MAAWTRVTDPAPQVAERLVRAGAGLQRVSQEAIRSFDNRAEDAVWRQLLIADGLLATGHLTDAFAIYRSVEAQLPSMVTIDESVANIYERSAHQEWAARERNEGVLPADACAKRKALCEFRAGRYKSALEAAVTETDAESRYWRARAAHELARASYAHLDTLPDSPEPPASRATIARAEDRHQDAVTELTAAVKLAPGNPTLTFELATACYAARNYEQALARQPAAGRASRSSRVREARRVFTLAAATGRRRVAAPAEGRGDRPFRPRPQLALGRAHVQRGDSSAAVPLIEPHLGTDSHGSLHVQLARAYTGVGQREKAAALLTKSQEIQRASEERSAEAARRKIQAPR